MYKRKEDYNPIIPLTKRLTSLKIDWYSIVCFFSVKLLFGLSTFSVIYFPSVCFWMSRRMIWRVQSKKCICYIKSVLRKRGLKFFEIFSKSYFVIYWTHIFMDIVCLLQKIFGVKIGIFALLFFCDEKSIICT